jgi:hypothetical protein
VRDAAAAHFLLIGEQHATADIAAFAQALHATLAPRGYTHAAYEVGPYSTDHAERLIRSGNGALGAYIRRPGHSFVLPFLFFEEEVALAERIVAVSPARKTLWGLDQEFVGSGPVASDLLRRWAKTPQERAAAAAFAAKSAADPMLVGKLSDADLAPLEKAFARNKPARDLIAALRLSSEIYAPFMGRGGSGYAANLRRETYMKTNFVARFLEAERLQKQTPRVFMKFGGSHAMRGFTATDVPGFGNFLYEWGLPRGLGLLNMMIDCRGGDTLDPQTNQRVPCEPYFGKDAALAGIGKGAGMTLIDLRPLRPRLRRLKALDARTREMILAFDYYLVIENVKAATPVAPLPVAAAPAAP